MTKTPSSLSDDQLIGRPENFDIHLKELRISKGAGFGVVLTGNIMTMQGFPKVPAALNVSVDESGESYGIF